MSNNVVIPQTGSGRLPAAEAAREHAHADKARGGDAKPIDGKSVEAPGGSVAATARKQLNVQIMQSSMEVTIEAGDKSLELLFRAAIDKINAFLEPELGPDAIQNAAAQDNSAAGTAERILSLSTGFFDAYAAQHPDRDPATLAEDFVALIRGGFEQGFNEAVDMLKGFEVFAGSVESEVMKTRELVHQGLDDFLASKLAPADAEPEFPDV